MTRPGDDTGRRSRPEEEWGAQAQRPDVPHEPGDGVASRGNAMAPADPWKSFRAVMAATLILEAIVVLLALPVVGAVGGGLTTAALVYLIGLAGLLIVLAGLQRRTWLIWVNLAVQVVPLAGFAVYPGVGFVGVLFTGLWALIAYLRAAVRSREQHGLFPPSG